ncbi:MAG: hypothetical protein PHX21_13575 [bacterium]|nr:hypothetical protein [bacterium]
MNTEINKCGISSKKIEKEHCNKSSCNMYESIDEKDITRKHLNDERKRN